MFQDVKVNSVVLTLRKDNSNLPINILQKGRKVNQISKDRWRSTDNLLIEFEISDEISFIVDKILKGSLLLDEIGECIQGLTPYDSYRGQSQEVIKNRLYHVKSKTDETCGRWLDGKFLNRYQLTYGDEWLKYGPWLAAPREARFFTGARLLFREIPGSGKRIQAVFTDQESYYGHSITPFLNKSRQIDILFILSVANSNLISWFATKKCSNFSKSIFPKLNPKDIKQLPIRNIDSECQRPFIEKADQMLSLNKTLQEISAKFQRTCKRKFENLNLTKKLQDWYNLSYTDFIKELSKQKIKPSLSEEAEWADYFDHEKNKALEIQSKIASTDKEIDQMVYELYGLSEEEIGIVEKDS